MLNNPKNDCKLIPFEKNRNKIIKKFKKFKNFRNQKLIFFKMDCPEQEYNSELKLQVDLIENFELYSKHSHESLSYIKLKSETLEKLFSSLKKLKKNNLFIFNFINNQASIQAFIS